MQPQKVTNGRCSTRCSLNPSLEGLPPSEAFEAALGASAEAVPDYMDTPHKGLMCLLCSFFECQDSHPSRVPSFMGTFSQILHVDCSHSAATHFGDYLASFRSVLGPAGPRIVKNSRKTILKLREPSGKRKEPSGSTMGGRVGGGSGDGL